MLRYDRQTKPDLVALYDIRPGNGAGPFLQPRSPHGATVKECSGVDSAAATVNLAPLLTEEPRQTSRFASVPFRGLF